MEDSKIIDLYFDRDERAISETAEKYGKLCMQVSMNILSVKATGGCRLCPKCRAPLPLR